MAKFIGALNLIREDLSSAPSDFPVLIIKTEILKFITNVQNICQIIGREECNIGHFVLSASIFHSLTKE